MIILDEESSEDRSRIARLLQLAERVKLSLAESRKNTAPVPIRGRYVLTDTTGKDVPIDERIARTDFVGMIKPLLERTIKHSRAALVKADVSEDEVDEILLVGGSSRGPWITDILKDAFPGASCRLFQPDLCVAAGAAIYAKMTLPPLVQAPQFELEMSLDIPSTISIDQVSIQGRLAGSDIPFKSLTVHLNNIEIGTKRTTRVMEDGRFSFPEEELENEGENRFRLSVADPDGNLLVDHKLSIFYEPLTSETATVMSVLPRALAVETVDGMATIAEAGASLPVICEQSFQRQNNNPSISLNLFQDYTAIGQIRIEGIPPEGGAGSLVEISIEVTDTGRIQGNAVIRTPEGEEVLTSNISIRLTPPEVPDRETLNNSFSEIHHEWKAICKEDGKRAQELESTVESRLDEIAKLFDQIPLERQEISAALKELNRILTPPDDGMNPSFSEFLKSVRRSRDAVEMLHKSVEEIEREIAEADPHSREVRSARKKISRQRRKATQISESLDGLESRASEIYANREHRSWAKVNESVMTLYASAIEHKRTGSAVPPGFLTKMRASFLVDQQIHRLNAAAEKLKHQDKLDDWYPEIRRIFAGLHRMKTEAAAIDDQLSDNQIMSKSRQLEIALLIPLQRAIDNLGVDISQVAESTGDISRSANATAIASKIGTDTKMDRQTAQALLNSGLTSIFEAVADEDTDIDYRDKHGHTTLMIAAARSQFDLMQSLIQKGANIEARNVQGRTPLMMAKNAKTSKLLLDKNADPNNRDQQGVTALMLAALEGDTDRVKLLLDGDAKVDYKWEGGHSALMLAAINSQVSTVALLLQRGAAVDLQCHNKRSALHYAAEANQKEVVTHLLEAGADINLQDKEGHTPLYLASIKNQLEIVKILILRGADASISSKMDRATPLMASCFYGLVDTVRLLVNATPDLEARDKDGDTALVNAAHHGSIPCIELLIESGCQLDTRNDKEQTALMIAAAKGNTEVVRCLLNHGLDPNLTDNSGYTATNYAEAADQKEVVELLACN
jgi:hypothetical protein